MSGHRARDFPEAFQCFSLEAGRQLCFCPCLQTGRRRLALQPGAGGLRSDAAGWAPGSPMLSISTLNPPPPHSHSRGRPCVAGDETLASELGGDQASRRASTDPAAGPKPASHFLEACASLKVSHPASASPRRLVTSFGLRGY